jgi:hypothetical protein
MLIIIYLIQNKEKRMTIQKITKITLLIALVALTRQTCYGAGWYNPRTWWQGNREDSAGSQKSPGDLPWKDALETQAGLDDLPNELILSIAQNLDPKSLMRMAQVNKRFKEVIKTLPQYELLKTHRGNLLEALIFAIKNKMPEMVDYLARHGANEPDADGNTVLHLAAYKGNAEAVRALLEKGALVNRTNNSGQTPLMLTIRGEIDRYGTGIMQVVPLLLAAGADVNIRDNENHTADHYLDVLEYNAAGIQGMVVDALKQMIPKPTGEQLGG